MSATSNRADLAASTTAAEVQRTGFMYCDPCHGVTPFEAASRADFCTAQFLIAAASIVLLLLFL